MSAFFGSLVSFVCGMAFSANLTILLGHNPNYEASWWKAGLAAAGAFLVPLILRTKGT